MAILGTLRSCAGEEVVAGSWLDVGCGSGGIAGCLSHHVASVTGVDPESWQQWEELTTNRSNLHLHVGKFDGDDLPIKEASFDVVVCNQVYEHVDNPELLLRNICHVLKPGGHCYFAGPNLLWPVKPHVYWPFVHWLPRDYSLRLMKALGSDRMSDLDAWSLDIWRLRSLILRAGFNWKDATPDRLKAGLALRGSRSLMRAVTIMPRIVFRLLLPFSPGFVLILHKPAGNR